MNVADWNAFDWVLATIVILSMARAFFTGLVRAVAGLAGFFAGFEVASWTYIDLGERIRDTGLDRVPVHGANGSLPSDRGGCGGGIRCTWPGLCASAAHDRLGMFDRILGVGFGFARGCLIGICSADRDPSFAPLSPVVVHSTLRPYLFTVAHDVSFLIPEYLQQRILDRALDCI